MPLHPSVQLIAFDVFGTVVDWHGGVAAEVERLAPGVDGGQFALAWRDGYRPAMCQVMAGLASGQGRFVKIDQLHREILDRIVGDFGLDRLDQAQRQALNRAWHRLPAWPDAVPGLLRLKQKFTVCALSNGNVALLTAMAKHAGLPWDFIASAELFGAYKPDPRTYLGLAALFGLAPSQLMLAATHQDDLDAARACGLATAYIERPHEFGAARPKHEPHHPANTLHVRDIAELAAMLC